MADNDGGRFRFGSSFAIERPPQSIRKKTSGSLTDRVPRALLEASMAVLIVTASACSDGLRGSTSAGSGGDLGSGGATGAGGSRIEMGGSTETGGGDGSVTSAGGGNGGTPRSGGISGSGGAAAGGASSGGVTGTGGTGSGGATAVDAAVGSGGTAAIDAGAASGGSLGKDASVSSGGAPARDASLASGGQSASVDASDSAGRIGSGGSNGGSGGVSGIGTAGATASGGAGGGAGTTDSGAKFVGNIDTRGAIRSDFTTYWNQFTPENAGKWLAVQPSSQNAFNWNTLDAMYKYCTDHSIIFKEHNFIWGSSQPAWMSGLTTTTGPEVVQNWMKSFCDRYPNTQLIDVVYEPPPHTTPVYAKVIGGAGSSGYDWIVNAYTWARAACPHAVLILADYNIIEDSAAHNNIINITQKALAAGAPIDAIGAQAHYAYKFSASVVQASIDDLVSQTGLPVYITEFDINVPDDGQQATIMSDLFPMFWKDKNVKGITLWGYIVGATWQNNTGLMRDDGTMRPAMTWLMDFLGR